MGAAATEGSAESGYRITTATVGPLGKQPIKDTPLSINAVSADFIDNLQASSASEALRYNPTVRPQLGSNLSANYFMIRGFGYSANGNAAVDGMRASVGLEPVEDKERIEVLNGVSSFLYGFSGPGGVINSMLKRPTATTLNKVPVGNLRRAAGLRAWRFRRPDRDGAVGYRLNIVKVGNGDVGIDRETHERGLVSVAFDWHIRRRRSGRLRRRISSAISRTSRPIFCSAMPPWCPRLPTSAPTTERPTTSRMMTSTGLAPA